MIRPTPPTRERNVERFMVGTMPSAHDSDNDLVR